MKKLCDRCGSTSVQTFVGSAYVCDDCEVKLKKEISELSKSNNTINAKQIARDYFKKKYSGSTYLLRNVPKYILKSWKKNAADHLVTQRDVVLAALIEYLKIK